MKIIFLCKTYGQVFRGGETFVGELGKNLSDLGHEVKILKTVGELWKEKKKPDVVIPVDGRWQVVLTKIWCLLNNKRLVISGQSGLGFDDKINLFVFPNAFVALSNHQADWAKNINPLVKVVTISNGVDLHKFKPEGEKISVNLPKPVILAVCALVPLKRVDLIIKAVAKLKKGSLLIVGKGEEYERLEKMGETFLKNRFKIMNFRYDQMPQVYRAADLLVFSTSFWESFGLVMLEAMATNLPVVVSDDPIRREIIGPAGFSVDVTDGDKFAKKIREALKKNWGNLPRNQAEKFGWDKIAAQYDQLFRHLTGL